MKSTPFGHILGILAIAMRSLVLRPWVALIFLLSFAIGIGIILRQRQNGAAMVVVGGFTNELGARFIVVWITNQSPHRIRSPDGFQVQQYANGRWVQSRSEAFFWLESKNADYASIPVATSGDIVTLQLEYFQESAWWRLKCRMGESFLGQLLPGEFVHAPNETVRTPSVSFTALPHFTVR